MRRPALVDVAEPREQVMEVLRRGVTDPSAAVRDRTLRGINSLPALWAGKGSTKLLLSALADDEPSLRRRGAYTGLDQAGILESARHDSNTSSDCWSIPTRRFACWPWRPSKRQGLIRHEPSLARRVKVLSRRPGVENAGTRMCSPPTISIPRRSIPTFH